MRDKLTVIDEIGCSCIVERLVDQESQLEVDSLSHWGAFTCVGCQVTLCDPIRQLTIRSCVTRYVPLTSIQYLYRLPFNYVWVDDVIVQASFGFSNYSGFKSASGQMFVFFY